MAEWSLLAIGLFGAFLSGLLGIGGAIVLIPLLALVPPWLGLPPLGMAAIGGMTIVQVLVSSFSGLLAHRAGGHLQLRVALPMGGAIALGSAVGGAGAGLVPDAALRGVFAALALAAAALMVLPAPAAAEGEGVPEDFQPGLAAALAGGVGVLSGLMGAGGAFLLAPLMRSVLKLPLRVIIGSSLAIVFASALTGTLAKALTGQIPWGPTLYLVAGALVGAPLGAAVSRRLPVKALRWLLAALVAATAVKMGWDVWG